MSHDHTHYELRLELLERNSTLTDEQATRLLHSEFTLAQNAGRFDALAPQDIVVEVTSRGTPQEGVTRYCLHLVLEERDPGLDDEGALALIRRAFTDALNASYFLRLCTDDNVMLELVSRAPLVAAQPRSVA
jgi:hypothetical protein